MHNKYQAAEAERRRVPPAKVVRGESKPTARHRRLFHDTAAAGLSRQGAATQRRLLRMAFALQGLPDRLHACLG